MSRYDQRVSSYVSPTWQDEWLGFIPGNVGVRDKGQPAARNNWPWGKPIVAGRTKSLYFPLSADNSFYGDSPHWDYPWLDARNITSTPQPALFSCFDR